MRPGLQTLLAPLVLHLVLQLLKLVYLVQLVQYVLVQLVQAAPQPVLQEVLRMMLRCGAAATPVNNAIAGTNCAASALVVASAFNTGGTLCHAGTSNT